jgi:hypothetical protein
LPFPEDSVPLTDRKYIDDRRRGRDDDVPIIGDFSGASDFGARPVSPQPPAAEQPASPQPRAAQRSANRPTTESWRLDPRDVASYARRTRGRESRAQLGTAVRFAAVLLAAAAAGVLVYWNYEQLRGLSVEWFAFARSSATSPGGSGAQAPSRDDSETIAVEPPVVVGTPERPVDGAEVAPEPAPRDPVTPRVASPAQTSPAPLATEAAPGPEPAGEVPTQPPAAAVPDSAVAAAAVVAPAAPPLPETFEFVAQVVTVSERQAGAAAVVRRSGGNLGPSSVVWRTSDGSATAGGDYANLGAIVERFAAGEKSRTIHVPIVGDSTAEGSESFFVTLGEGDGAGEGVEPAQRLEIVIEDDD